jgi:pyruvate/2-oxoglutarate dehydrogenase complex dihydrolipoamide acyltransferase (E2) component
VNSSHHPARWSGGKRSVAASSPSAPEKATVADPLPAAPDELEATDAAKALAAQHNIDLDAITGTGQDGRITKEDVAALVPAEEPPQHDESAAQPTENSAVD